MQALCTAYFELIFFAWFCIPQDPSAPPLKVATPVSRKHNKHKPLYNLCYHYIICICNSMD